MKMEAFNPQEEAKEICRDGLKKLAWINLRLEQIAEEIKESQPKSKGAITLSLYKCGHGCLSCNHLQWHIWGVRKNKQTADAQFLAHKLEKSPLLHLRVPRKGFEEGHEKTKALIQEALALESERSNIAKALSLLKRACKFKV